MTIMYCSYLLVFTCLLSNTVTGILNIFFTLFAHNVQLTLPSKYGCGERGYLKCAVGTFC